jgi:beta-mannosidase
MLLPSRDFPGTEVAMTKKLFALACLGLLMLAHAALAQTRATSKVKVALHSGWKFRQAGKQDWRAATVPGCVHTDLLANRLIEDPFYRDNEARQQWIGKTDWEYETTFDVPAALAARRHAELVFEGLDTYAEVFLNDRRLLSADNMFRTWRVDAKPALRPGANTLRVVFRSPINEVLPLMAKMKYQLPTPNDQGEKTSPHTRKAGYHYGWDWGPRFVTSGIWRPVSLEVWDAARVADLHLAQWRVGPESASLTAAVEVVGDATADAVVVVENLTDRTAVGRRAFKLTPGTNRAVLDFVVERPRLWWPSGLGRQPLYDFRARLLVNGRVVDEATARTGLRSVELRQRPDAGGKSFEFVVNGVPVFMKGANWVPADSFPTRVTRERYRQLLTSARDANMNMLRVWGGGIYEPADFYELCDELGLLVWQDFMFACAMYPGDEKFLESVREEAADNVRRLRNHPSIALWCGNNEVETAWQHWGWKQNLPAALWDDYLRLFHGVLPAVVAEHDPARAYWPSSPSSDLEEDPDSRRSGDVHYWEVWHASKPFSEYEAQRPRFMSEYGFQSFPDIETVRAYTVPSDHHIESPVMLAHQRHPRGNQLIREYMLREYPEPKDFESFLHVSQILQAEGIRVGAEHLRRLMPHNMGSLYWQMNDCWPVASWSGVDYFGRWKALNYYARRFYADLLVSPNEEGGHIKLYVVSDRTRATDAELRVRLLDFEGRTLTERAEPVRIAPLESRAYLSLPASELLRGRDASRVFLHAELVSGGQTVSSNTHFFRPYKELALPAATITTAVAETRGQLHVTVSADRLARGVRLSAEGVEGSFSDNYFDLVPGRPVTVIFRAPRSPAPADFRARLRARSLADAFAARRTN